jgi:putative endonuclease
MVANHQPSYVYIMASKKDGVLYVGVTSNLIQRICQHRSGIMDGFTKKYFVKRLVYYEVHENIEDAIKKEKMIKSWQRQWKINLIEKDNQNWEDLFEHICK